MTFDEYQELAMRTDGTTEFQDRLINATLGLNGEAGEFADMVKKNLFHGHPLTDRELKKELGDILWYVAQACKALRTSMDEVATQNIDKLRKRYPEGFSSERSINRTD